MSAAAAHTETVPTLTEMVNSLTGFEELAIEKHMDVDIYDVVNFKNVLTRRLLIFVHKQRSGLSPSEAVTAARSMTSREVIDYFAADPEEVDDDEPETPEGKGSSSSGSEPESSPPGAS